MYTRFASGALFPVHEWLKGHHSVALRKALERTQWLGPGEIERLQLARLKQFLVEAGASVPYYRRLFERSGLIRAACRPWRTLAHSVPDEATHTGEHPGATFRARAAPGPIQHRRLDWRAARVLSGP